jgi:hypothetical protein
MVDLFEDFYMGHMDIKRVNYGIITLPPKTMNCKNKPTEFSSLDPYAC